MAPFAALRFPDGTAQALGPGEIVSFQLDEGCDDGPLLGQAPADEGSKIVNAFTKSFTPARDFAANYMLIIEGSDKNLLIKVNEKDLSCYFGPTEEDVDVIGKLPMSSLEKIMAGKQTFQGAFMTGAMSAKGNFKKKWPGGGFFTERTKIVDEFFRAKASK